MSSAARSVYVFGVYLLGVGGILIGTPNTLMRLMGMPAVSEPWIHVLGVVVMAIGMMDLISAKAEQTGYFRATVTARIFVFVSFVILAALEMAPLQLVGFGVIDLAGALWTRAALRAAPAAVAV